MSYIYMHLSSNSILLHAGADATKANAKGESPFSFATRYWLKHKERFEGQTLDCFNKARRAMLEVVKMVLYGASVQRAALVRLRHTQPPTQLYFLDDDEEKPEEKEKRVLYMLAHATNDDVFGEALCFLDATNSGLGGV